MLSKLSRKQKETKNCGRNCKDVKELTPLGFLAHIVWTFFHGKYNHNVI